MKQHPNNGVVTVTFRTTRQTRSRARMAALARGHSLTSYLLKALCDLAAQAPRIK